MYGPPLRPCRLAVWPALSAVLLASCGGSAPSETAVFELRIANVAAAEVQGDAGPYEVLFSPGWARLDAEDPLFTEGQPAGARLELLAEGGDPVGFAGTPGWAFPAGVEVTYEGEPLAPGTEYRVRFEAEVGDQLSFATMFVRSNDIFLGARGIALFDAEGAPVSGDFTSAVGLFDAGTEVNEAPGGGAAQPGGDGVGTPENGVVTRVEGTDAQGHSYPALDQLVRVELAACTSLDAC